MRSSGRKHLEGLGAKQGTDIVDVLQKLEKTGPPEGSISTGLWHQAKIWTEDASLIVVAEAEFDPCKPKYHYSVCDRQ
jgi:hypothetical protein